MTDEAISLTAAAFKFGISISNLRNAVDFGIIHIQPTTDTRSRYLLSRSEIESKIELIKKSNKKFFKLLEKGRRMEEREAMHELIKSGVRGKEELYRHGVPSIVLNRFFPKPVAGEDMFYCMRSNTWVPACKIDNCNLQEKCQGVIA